jgi:hypothetical protein
VRPCRQQLASLRAVRPPERSTQSADHLRLRTLDNEDAGTIATTLSDWREGMEFIGHGNRRLRIVSIDDGLALWWVEPVEPGQVRNSD